MKFVMPYLNLQIQEMKRYIDITHVWCLYKTQRADLNDVACELADIIDFQVFLHGEEDYIPVVKKISKKLRKIKNIKQLASLILELDETINHNIIFNIRLEEDMSMGDLTEEMMSFMEDNDEPDDFFEW